MTSPRSLADQLKQRAETAEKRGLRERLHSLGSLLHALEEHDLPEEELEPFMTEIEEALAGDELRRGTLEKIEARLAQELEKTHGLVRPHHYRDQWLALGMASFGLPLGVAFGLLLDQMAYIGIGLPLGIAIGSAIGARKDQEAERAGRVLSIDAQ